jgi:hypothetical protein
MTPTETMLLAGITCLGTVITIMWNKLGAENKRLSDRSDECEKDREKLWSEVGEAKGVVVLLQRCPQPACPFKEATPALGSARRDKAA